MKFLISFLLLLSAALTYNLANAGRHRRFVGGQSAELGQFPYVVSLRSTKNKEIFCTGTIIHQRFILTAGHCVTDLEPSEFYVVAGTNNISAKSKRYYVEGFGHHSRLNRFLGTFDIAVIKLKKKIKFSQYIQKISLSNSSLPEGTTATVVGWGSKGIFRRTSRTLQFANVTTISLKKCRSHYRKVAIRVINNMNICTFDPPDTGFCNGDSGGPLIYNGTQVGLVSWSRFCAEYPDVYVNVSAYIHWIHAVMKKLQLH